MRGRGVDALELEARELGGLELGERARGLMLWLASREPPRRSVE